MFEIHAWWAVAARLIHYFAYRLGLAKICTPFDDIYAEGTLVIGRVFRWNTKMRTIGVENMPPGPAVFVANHIRFDDPIVMFIAIGKAVKGRYYARFMMRTGAFEGGWLKSRILDMDELATLVAAIQIDRDNVTLKQLKPFVKRLKDGGVFGMYIGRTRSRSGMLLEYTEFDEPGSASFFMAQAPQGPDGEPVAAIPLVRTMNPVTGGSTFVFGKAHYLPEKADRAAQRALDFDCVAAMGELVEVNGPHLVALNLYLRCLHNLPLEVTRNELADDVAAMRDAIDHPYVAPELTTRLPKVVAQTVAYLEKAGQVKREGGRIVLNREAILAVPEKGASYRKANPVKYLVNQILHLQQVIADAEIPVLASRR